MGTAIKHPVPDRVKPSFVIFDIQALWRTKNFFFQLNYWRAYHTHIQKNIFF